MYGKVIAAYSVQQLYIVACWALALRCLWLNQNCRQEQTAREHGNIRDLEKPLGVVLPGSLYEAWELGRATGLWEAGALKTAGFNASEVLARYGFNISKTHHKTEVLGLGNVLRSQQGIGIFMRLLSLGNLLYAVSAIGMAIFLVPTLWYVGKPFGRSVMKIIYWAAGHLWHVVLLLKPVLPAAGYTACFLAVVAADHIPSSFFKQIAVTACHMAATGISAYEDLGIVLAAEARQAAASHGSAGPVNRSRMVRTRCAVPVLIFVTFAISSSAVLYRSSYLGCYSVVLSYLLLNYSIAYAYPGLDWLSLPVIRINQVASLCWLVLLGAASAWGVHWLSTFQLGISLFASLGFYLGGYLHTFSSDDRSMSSHFYENIIYFLALMLGMVFGAAQGLVILQNMAVAFFIIWVLTRVAVNVDTLGQACFALFAFFALVGLVSYMMR